MGDEFAQFIEWDYRKELDWLLLDYDAHRAMQDFVRELNACYRAHDALYENDSDWDGFSWLVVDDKERNVFAFTRTSRVRTAARGRQETIVCVFNFSAVKYEDYRIDLPFAGAMTLLLDTSGAATVTGAVAAGFAAEEMPIQTILDEADASAGSFAPLAGQAASAPGAASFTLPPLSAQYYLLSS
jgi:1,4-alpha-glucan branching enzyme